MHHRKRFVLSIALLASVLALTAGGVSARITLWATGELNAVPVGKPGASKAYLQVDPGGLVLPLAGPGEISGFVKVHYGPNETGGKSAELRFAGVPGLPASQELAFTAPTRGEYGDRRPGRPSGGKKISLSIPDGRHDLKITGEVAGGGELFLILYYDGPEQPLPGDFQPPVLVEAEPPEEKKPFARWKSSASVKFIYNDNPFKYSSGFAAYYFDGHSEEKLAKFYRVERFDDLVINPSVMLEARRKQFSSGETRLGFQFSMLQYWHNPVLTNGEFRVTLRQYAGKGKSFEIYYSYSPAKYLRRLNDRPPTSSDNNPMVSRAFFLTRNNIVAAWRHKLSKNVSGKLQLTKQLYYYNKPHVENDMDMLDFRMTLYWTLAKPWRLTLDYAFKDADGLGIDVEGQSLATSPASDGSHKKNMYQADLRWRPPYKWLVSSISARARYAVSYFSAEGNVVIEGDSSNPLGDAYHVGRMDNEYAYRLAATRSLKEISKGLNGEIGFQYGERDVESPWWGDIREDKNWIQRTYWFKLSYTLL